MSEGVANNMPNMGDVWRQAHVDIEVVSGKVNTLEAGFTELKTHFSTLQRDMQVGFSQQAQAFSQQMNNLADKIVQQGSAYAASRNTSISSVLITAASVATVVLSIIGAFGYITIGPFYEFEKDAISQMRRIEENAVKHDDFHAYVKQMADFLHDYTARQDKWSENLRDRLRSDEDNAVSQRQITELTARFDERNRLTADYDKERFNRIESLINLLDAQLVKRPEIESANRSQDGRMQDALKTQDERFSALSARLNAIQAQMDATFPPGKVIDELWRALSEIRTGSVPTK